MFRGHLISHTSQIPRTGLSLLALASHLYARNRVPDQCVCVWNVIAQDSQPSFSETSCPRSRRRPHITPKTGVNYFLPSFLFSKRLGRNSNTRGTAPFEKIPILGIFWGKYCSLQYHFETMIFQVARDQFQAQLDQYIS